MKIFNYSQAISIPKSLLSADIEDFTPTITKDDIDKQFIYRYFCKQVNQPLGEIVEIDSNTYSKLTMNNMYKAIQIIWRIAGPLDDIPGPPNINTPTRLYTGVITANTLTIQQAEKDLPGMKYKVINFTQFYQFDVNTITNQP